MSEQTHVKIPGSDLARHEKAIRARPVDQHETVQVNLLVRRRKAPPIGKTFEPAERRTRHLSREELRDRFGADPADLKSVAKSLEKFGLDVTETDAAKRSVVASGPVSAVNAAFKVELREYAEPDGRTYRSYEGALHAPVEIADLVLGVFGLNDAVRFHRGVNLRPPHRPGFPVPPAVPLTIPQLISAYKFPPFATGAGQTIGLVELGGGFLMTDITSFFGSLGLPAPTIVTGRGANGGVADVEVTADIEVAGGAAPGATLVVYFASSASMDDVFANIQMAVNDTVNNPTVLSLSFAVSEDTFGMTDMYRNGLDGVLADAGMMGITVCAGSGDDGATDHQQHDGNAHCMFPASSPHALAVGGTALRLGLFGQRLETVWNDGIGATGGGISTAFPVPMYQVGVGLPPSANPGKGPGRGVPDVAAFADVPTGYVLFIGGSATTVGGTSLSTPLWAALIARLNQAVGFSVGFVNPHLYALRGSKAFTDITLGNNDIGNDMGGYAATQGWDCCTGLGTPVGTELVNAFAMSVPTQFFAPNQITCGYSQPGFFFLDKPDTVPITVQLVSSHPEIVSVLPTITITPGSFSIPVTFTAPAISGPFLPKFVDVRASVGFTTLIATAEVVPPRLVSMTLSPDTVTCGQSTQCTISLNLASMKGDVIVELFCGDPGYATVPPSATIHQGDTSTTFTIMTPSIAVAFAPAQISILAVYRSSQSDPGTSAAAVLTVQPVVIAGIVHSLTLNPSTVTDGANSYGIVTLLNSVPTPTVVGLLAVDPGLNPLMPGSASSAATVQSSFTIAAGHPHGQFTITTSGNSVTPGHNRHVTIMAAAVAIASATLTIER